MFPPRKGDIDFIVKAFSLTTVHKYLKHDFVYSAR